MIARCMQAMGAVIVMLAALPAGAHHSQAIYDTTRTITFRGVVTEYRWANPHTYLYVETENEAGDNEVRAVEMQVTAIMSRLGWDRNSFSPGDEVIVQAYPSRDPERRMALIYSATKDGVTFSGDWNPLRSLSDAPAKADSLAGTWEVPFTELIPMFSDPSDWPVTEQAAAGMAAYDDTMNPQLQCIPRTSPWLMIFTGLHRIELDDDVIMLRTEYDTVNRRIFMNGSHDGAEITPQGHSIGRWEGDTLVVDTTHFADNLSGSARGIRSGAQKHLVEYFTLNPDGEGLTYRFELEDPESLTDTVTGELQAAYRPDLPFNQVPCDLDTAGRFNEQAE